MVRFLHHPEVLEIIVLDNGSKEKPLLQLLQHASASFSKLEVIYSPENLGIAKGRKKLFDLAKGEYIISLDSDVTILDPDYLLQSLKRNLKPLPWEPFHSPIEDNLFLLGGGGGQHLHFPTLYMTDVKNEVNRPKKNEFIVVDEVAGWCHCFRKALLQKVEMDEQFSPFWGEDSDFCIQIKHLGGKCAILGKGVIGHKFSSCRKDETRKPLKKMWEKLLQKWYPLPDTLDTRFCFPLDQQFYMEVYGTETPIQDYFGEGIFHGKMYNMKIIERIIPGAEDMQPEKIENLLSISNLSKFYYRIVSTNISCRGYDDLYIVNWYLPGGYHKKIDDIPSEANVIFIQHGDMKIEKSVQDRFKKIMIVRRDNNGSGNLLYSETVLLALFQFIKDYQIDTIKMIGFGDSWKGCKKGDAGYLDSKYNRRGLRELIRGFNEPLPDISRTKFNFDLLKKIYNSYPIKKMLHASLMIPNNHDNLICPEYSPRHILPELFVRMCQKCEETNFLTIVIGEDDSFSSRFGTGDILYIDTDPTLNKVPAGVDYYFQKEDIDLFTLFEFLDSPKTYFIYEYDIISVIDLRKINITGNVDEFYERSRYQNQIFVQGDSSFFSFAVSDLDNITKLRNFLIEKGTTIDKKINIQKSFMANLFDKIYFSPIWKKKKIQKGIEQQTYFYRDDDKLDYERRIDFPLLMKD